MAPKSLCCPVAAEDRDLALSDGTDQGRTDPVACQHSVGAAEQQPGQPTGMCHKVTTDKTVNAVRSILAQLVTTKQETENKTW